MGMDVLRDGGPSDEARGIARKGFKVKGGRATFKNSGKPYYHSFGTHIRPEHERVYQADCASSCGTASLPSCSVRPRCAPEALGRLLQWSIVLWSSVCISPGSSSVHEATCYIPVNKG